MIKTGMIEEEIEKYKIQLNNTEKELDRLRKKIPPGVKLYAMKKGKVFQYFMRTKSDETHGKYITRQRMKTAEMLAQIEYDENLVDALDKSVKYLEEMKRKLDTNPFVAAEQKMSYGKRALINRTYITDEEYVRAWKEKNYETMEFRETEKRFYTRTGLRVRSKSELIIAEMLEEEGIPFCYEKPLKLKYKTFYPDFTLLNIKEKKEIYWEHFGMMDDIDYRNSAFVKIREYENNGLYQYDSMICTFETLKYPLNTKSIQGMIESLRKKLGY